MPDFAESYYYVRNADPEIVRSVMKRVQAAAEGAAMATGTSVSFEATGGVYAMLGNDALAEVMQRSLKQVGGVTWSAPENAWAARIAGTLPTTRAMTQIAEVVPISRADGGGSTDVADISWVSPTVGLATATWVPGTPAHSWQAVAASGMSIGFKGSVVAAKTLALAAATLFRDPATLVSAKAELLKRRGADFRYRAMIGERAGFHVRGDLRLVGSGLAQAGKCHARLLEPLLKPGFSGLRRLRRRRFRLRDRQSRELRADRGGERHQPEKKREASWSGGPHRLQPGSSAIGSSSSDATDAPSSPSGTTLEMS